MSGIDLIIIKLTVRVEEVEGWINPESIKVLASVSDSSISGKTSKYILLSF
jgi:hypothetical protein